MLKNVLMRLSYFNLNFNNHKNKFCDYYKNLSRKRFSKVNGCLISLDFEQGNLFETTACNIAMSRNKNIKRKYFSFDLITRQQRGVIEEASRILRDDVDNINQLNSNRLDFMIIPGGNIFDSLLKQNFDLKNDEILSELSRVIREFNAMKKPILFTSNSSILACKILGKNNLGPGLTVTYGVDSVEWNNKQYIQYAMDQGNFHKSKREDEHCVDDKNSIVTIPGNLKNNSNLNAVFDSIEKGIMSIYNHIKYQKG